MINLKDSEYTIKQRKALKKKAWAVFSRFIRNRDGNRCVTCGKTREDGYVMNGGHFIHKKEDFNEVNINCQCFVCNKIKKGNMRFYTIYMIEKYGMQKVKELLEKEKEESVLYTGKYYKDIIEKYSNLLPIPPSLE